MKRDAQDIVRISHKRTVLSIPAVKKTSYVDGGWATYSKGGGGRKKRIRVRLRVRVRVRVRVLGLGLGLGF